MGNILLVVVLLFKISVMVHSIEVELSSQRVSLGEPIKLTVKTSSPLSTYKVSFLNKSFQLFLESHGKNRYRYEAFFAASRKQKKGEYPLIVSIQTVNNNTFYNHFKIDLNYPDQVKSGVVTLGKKAKKLSDNINDYQKESRLISKYFQTKSPTRFFSGPFIRPAKGRLSSGFAAMRKYNNGKTSSHAGVDIANKKNTRIISPESGIVILSQSLTIHGETIMVDHGQGVVSIFCHLNERVVDKGMRVQKGDILGKMGRTGVASGVHLHWGLSVQNIRVDPLFWLLKTNSFM